MVRRGVSVGLSVAAVLAIGAMLGRAPLSPAAAQEPRTRQIVAMEDAFSFSAIVPPGGTVLLDRPPEGSVFLVTDVLVQNVPIGGGLANTESLSLADKSLITVGSATRVGVFLDQRRLGGGLTVRVSGRDLERIHLESGFVPVDRTESTGERLAIFNSPDASAAAFVQVYGQLIDGAP